MSPAMVVQTGPVVQAVAGQPDALVLGEGVMAEPTVGAVVGVLQPGQVALHHALFMTVDHTVFTDIHSVLKTKLVGDFPFWTFA